VVAVNYPDRYPTWAAENAGTNRQPTVIGVFFRLTLILALLIALGAYGPARAWADRQSEQYPTLCDEHRGRPGWSSVCPSTRSIPVKAKHRPTDLDGLD
jgi:hypothetical protein